MATATKTKLDKVAAAIKKLYRQHGGELHPSDVVDAARAPGSPLHRFFTWDDSKAASEYRLWQARHLIARVRVVVPVSQKRTIQVRAYHALRSDRGGYRHAKDILGEQSLRDDLLTQLGSDLDSIREKYACLTNLAETSGLFTAISEFVASHKK